MFNEKKTEKYHKIKKIIVLLNILNILMNTQADWILTKSVYTHIIFTIRTLMR